MNVKHLPNLGLTFLVWLALILGATACEPEPTGPRAWIDFPLDGAIVPAGAPVTVLSHVFAPAGVAEVLLSVNGVAYRRSPPSTTGDFAKASHEWFPDREGDFVLEVTAFSSTGEASAAARARVKVLGKTVTTPTLVAPAPATTVPSAPDLAIVNVEAVVAGNKGGVPFCNTRVTYRNVGTAAIPRDFVIQFHFNGVPTLANTIAGGLPPGATDQIVFVYQFESAPYIGINLDSTNVIAESNEANNAFAEARACGATPVPITPTATPTLATRTPTATATLGIAPLPPAQVNFRADRTALTQGECTMLRWDVENATGVFLDGNGVAGHGSQPVCPNKTTTYNLHVTAPAGNVDRSVTISVQAAPATHTPTRTRTRTPTTPPDTTPPPIPNPQDPTGGKSVACSGAAGSATLRWSSVSDPSGVTYYVKWSGGGQSGGWNGAGTSHGISIKCGYQYSWQVRACDGKGNCSGWSGSATFLAGTLH